MNFIADSDDILKCGWLSPKSALVDDQATPVKCGLVTANDACHRRVIRIAECTAFKHDLLTIRAGDQHPAARCSFTAKRRYRCGQLHGRVNAAEGGEALRHELHVVATRKADRCDRRKCVSVQSVRPQAAATSVTLHSPVEYATNDCTPSLALGPQITVAISYTTLQA